jgi:hypothetical protein
MERPRNPVLILVARTALAAAALGLLSVAPPLAAYDYTVTARSYMGMARASTLHSIGQAQLRETTGRAFSASAPSAPAAAGAAALNFTPTPQVRAAVRENMIAGLSNGNAKARAQLEQAFANDVVLKDFDQLLHNYGYSGTNLADVLTGYEVISWEVVNGMDASHDAAGIHAANAQLRAAILASPRLLALSDADKQRIAEGLAYQCVIATGVNRKLVEARDLPSLQEFRSQVRQAAMQWGADPLHLLLTDRGFVRRS